MQNFAYIRIISLFHTFNFNQQQQNEKRKKEKNEQKYSLFHSVYCGQMNSGTCVLISPHTHSIDLHVEKL